MSEKNVTHNIVEVQVLQSQLYEKIEYFQCYVSYSVTITRCGKWGGRNMLKKAYNIIDELTHAQCEDTHRHMLLIDPARKYISVPIKQGRGYYNGIVEGTSIDDGDCSGSTYVDHSGHTHDSVSVHYEIRVTVNTGMADLNIDDKKD